jgi:hypothetical protein
MDPGAPPRSDFVERRRPARDGGTPQPRGARMDMTARGIQSGAVAPDVGEYGGPLA